MQTKSSGTESHIKWFTWTNVSDPDWRTRTLLTETEEVSESLVYLKNHVTWLPTQEYFIELLLLLYFTTTWLWHCATSRKVAAGSIPYDVTGIFHWHNPSGRIMALTKKSTMNIS